MTKLINISQETISNRFNYLMQSSTVHGHTLQVLKSLAYKFIWGSQKEIALDSMMLPRNEGGMGINDFEAQQSATLIQCTHRLWENKGIWSS